MDNQSPKSSPQGNSNTLTIILAVALILALAAIAFLLVFYVFGGENDADNGEEVAPPIATFAPTTVVPPTVEAPVALPLIGPDWVLAGTMEGTTISLVFAADNLFGFAGCNSYNAGYLTTLAAGSTNGISISSVSSTQVLCDDAVMNQEQAYLANLATASQYTISGNTLTLTTGNGPLIFQAAVAMPLTP